jgi:hypothetical protein
MVAILFSFWDSKLQPLFSSQWEKSRAPAQAVTQLSLAGLHMPPFLPTGGSVFPSRGADSSAVLRWTGPVNSEVGCV